MTAGTDVRALRRRWVLVALGALVAAACGLLLLARAERAPTFVATEQVVLDTVPSQLTTAAPRGGDTLRWRLALFARLLTGDAERSTIARIAGAAPGEVAISEPTLAVPPLPTALATKAAEVVTGTQAANSVTLTLQGTLPILRIEAAATGRDAAGALSAATSRRVATLVRKETRGARGQPLAVRRVGRPTIRRERTAGSNLASLALPVAAFAAWCWLIVVLGGPRRRRPTRQRTAAARAGEV